MTSNSLILARLAYLQAEIDAITALVRLQELSEGSAPAVLAPPAPAPTPVAAPAPAAAPAAPAPAHAPAPVAAPAAARAGKPVRAAAPGKRAKRPAQFSYVPTAAYRITGANPFRNGNNLALFNHLVSIFGDSPFTRTQLGDQIAALRADGTIKSEMEEQPMVIGFLRFAGIEKGRIEMVSSGTGDAPPAPAAKAPKASKAPKAADKAPAEKRPAKVIRRAKKATDDDLPEEA